MFNTIRQTAALLSTSSTGDSSALLNADHDNNTAQFTSLKVLDFPLICTPLSILRILCVNQATGDSFVDGYMGYVSYRKQLDPFVSIVAINHSSRATASWYRRVRNHFLVQQTIMFATLIKKFTTAKSYTII